MIAGVTLHNFLLIGFLASLFIIAVKWLGSRQAAPAGLRSLTQNL